MTRQQKIDMAYGRRGGHWRDNNEDLRIDRCPRCSVCGLPMVVGQKVRHGVCSPLMPCCDARQDMVRDKDLHAKQHAELDGLS